MRAEHGQTRGLFPGYTQEAPGGKTRVSLPAGGSTACTLTGAWGAADTAGGWALSSRVTLQVGWLLEVPPGPFRGCFNPSHNYFLRSCRVSGAAERRLRVGMRERRSCRQGADGPPHAEFRANCPLAGSRVQESGGPMWSGLLLAQSSASTSPCSRRLSATGRSEPCLQEGVWSEISDQCTQRAGQSPAPEANHRDSCSNSTRPTQGRLRLCTGT